MDFRLFSTSNRMQDKPRYYFRLRKSIEALCDQYDRPMPTRDALEKKANRFGFQREEFATIFTESRGPFGDGMLEALASWFDVDPLDLVELTTDEPEHLKVAAGDVFLRGLDRMVLWLTNNAEYVVHERSYLRTESEVARAARDIQLSAGWQVIAHDSKKIDEESLMTAAIQQMGIEDQWIFEEKLLNWWRVNKHVCMFAYNLAETRCGSTCLLPVSDVLYDGFKAGKLRELDIEPEDIQKEARRFILVASSDSAYKLAPKYREAATRAVAGCVFAQLAHLVPEGAEEDIRAMSFAPTPTARQRLISTGFEEIPIHLAGTQFPLFEFSSNASNTRKVVRAIEKARKWIKSPRRSRKSRP